VELCRLAREKQWREKKKAQKVNVYQERVTAYNDKETAKMDQLRAMVAMAGGKITIAKRESEGQCLICTVLDCSILNCTVLYCTVLYCTVLY